MLHLVLNAFNLVMYIYILQNSTSFGINGEKKQSIIFKSEKVRFPSVDGTISFKFLLTYLMVGSMKFLNST